MTEEIYAVTVPKWGIEMQEGTVVGWHVDTGSEIAKGDELIDIETDKIVNTLEAPGSGVLHRQLAQKEDTLVVGALLGVIGPADAGADEIEKFIAEFVPAEIVAVSDEATPGDVGAAKPATPASGPAPELADTGRQRVRVSPAAAQRARELGVDISQVRASGRRISPQDVERHAREHAVPERVEAVDAGYESIPMSATRKTIARRLVEAKQQIPHFYLSMDIVMDAALARREEINAGSGQKVSVNDVVLRAVVLALQSVPDVNVNLVQDEIRRFRHVNLAIAVATGRGLMTPVISGAERMSVTELAKQAAALGERARDASLMREESENGTFTVSNLGMHGVTEFQAIINPPQGAILAVGACESRVIAENEEFRTARMMRVTLSCDHRVIDGALGAQFLAKLKNILEEPAEL